MLKVARGSVARLKRIMAIKQCSQEQALDFAISCGWLAAEKMEAKRLANLPNAQIRK